MAALLVVFGCGRGNQKDASEGIGSSELAAQQRWGFLLMKLHEDLKQKQTELAIESIEVEMDRLIVMQASAMAKADKHQKEKIRQFLSWMKTFRRAFPRCPIDAGKLDTTVAERAELAEKAREALMQVAD
jgi:hypothetical protein